MTTPKQRVTRSNCPPPAKVERRLGYSTQRSQESALTPFHFCGINIGTWRTNANLDQLIADMSSDEAAFHVFYIPLPEESRYDINMLTGPMVKDTVYLGTYN